MIPLVKTAIPPRDVLLPALEEVLYGGYIAQGPRVDKFEQRFREYIGSGYSVSLNSGTAALHLALALVGATDGDEIISTALTAEPTNVAIKMTGAKIRYADIDYRTGNISPESVRERINDKTKAILVVDYAGIPVDVNGLKSVSQEFDIPVIEDAAHALGARFNHKLTGCHFPYTIYSFQAIKHITTVDGGMLQVLDEEDYEKAKLMRWFGLDKTKTRLTNNIELQGYKYHMNDVAATIGLLQMDSLESTVNAYISNGKYLDEKLTQVAGLELIDYYHGSEPSYWLYTCKVENREGLIKKLAEHGIMASPLHMRNDHHTYLNDFNDELPALDLFYKKMIHIPCGWWVTAENRENIVSVIKSGW